MRLEICDDIACAKARAYTRRGISILVVSICVWMTSAASTRADDTAALQRIEAQIQRLEARHESEIKALQAEIRRLRRQKPETVTATHSPPADQPRSSTAPSGVPAPALPASCERSASELAIPIEVKKKSTRVAPHRTAASTRVSSHETIVSLLSDLMPLATTIEPTGYCSLKLPARPEEIQISIGPANAFLSSSCDRRIPIPVLTIKISLEKSGAPSPAPISD